MDQLKINEAQQFGLLKAMNITMKDLDLNRSGVLSDAQRRRLRRDQIVGALGWWLVAILGQFPSFFQITGPQQMRISGIN